MQVLSRNLVLLLCLCCVLCCGCPQGTGSAIVDTPSASETPALDKALAPLRALQTRLAPLSALHAELGPVYPGEWRSFWNEPEQTPRAYVLDLPNTQTTQAKTLYIQPVGDFDATQLRMLGETEAYLRAYFGCPVKRLRPMPTSALPREALYRRQGQPDRLRTGYINTTMREALQRKDGWGTMAISTLDLYADGGREGVYGETLLFGKAGVSSMARLGDASTPAGYALARTRLVKCATHESAHLFTLRHCRTYRCGMNGRIKLAEFDAAPTRLCPQCLAKLMYALDNADPVARFQRLAPVAKQLRLTDDAAYFRKAAQILSQ